MFDFALACVLLFADGITIACFWLRVWIVFTYISPLLKDIIIFNKDPCARIRLSQPCMTAFDL